MPRMDISGGRSSCLTRRRGEGRPSRNTAKSTPASCSREKKKNKQNPGRRVDPEREIHLNNDGGNKNHGELSASTGPHLQ